MLNTGLLFEENVIQKWMRDRFLQDLVSECRNDKPDLREQFASLKLNPYYTFPAIALFEPSARHRDAHEKILYAERLREFVQKQLPDGNTLFLDEEGRLSLLFSWASGGILETMREQINVQFSECVNVGVGKPCSHLSDMFHSYKQAAKALQHKFYRGAGEIIYYTELGQYGRVSQYPIELENKLFADFQASETAEELEAAVSAYYESVLDNGLVIRQSMYDLTVKLLLGLEKKALSKADNVGAYNPLEVMSIVGLETLEELKQYASRFLAGLKEVISHTQKESQRSIIKKTIHYMEQECQQASLQSVAQKVYMTPTYLSLLFKVNTGKTFIEHLTDIRMDKAKDMLKSTHYKNYEVAEKVGYQDPRYFSQIFKKKVGLSPSEYRESVGK